MDQRAEFTAKLRVWSGPFPPKRADHIGSKWSLPVSPVAITTSLWHRWLYRANIGHLPRQVGGQGLAGRRGVHA